MTRASITLVLIALGSVILMSCSPWYDGGPVRTGREAIEIARAACNMPKESPFKGAWSAVLAQGSWQVTQAIELGGSDGSSYQSVVVDAATGSASDCNLILSTR